MKPWKVTVVGHQKIGFWHVRIVAGNGEIVMQSEIYDNKSNADRAAKRIVKASQQGFELKQP